MIELLKKSNCISDNICSSLDASEEGYQIPNTLMTFILAEGIEKFSKGLLRVVYYASLYSETIPHLRRFNEYMFTNARFRSGKFRSNEFLDEIYSFTQQFSVKELLNHKVMDGNFNIFPIINFSDQRFDLLRVILR